MPITGIVTFDRRIIAFTLASMRQAAEMSDQLDAAVTMGLIESDNPDVAFVRAMRADNMAQIAKLESVAALYDSGAPESAVQAVYQEYLDLGAVAAVKGAALKGYK